MTIPPKWKNARRNARRKRLVRLALMLSLERPYYLPLHISFEEGKCTLTAGELNEDLYSASPTAP